MTYITYRNLFDNSEFSLVIKNFYDKHIKNIARVGAHRSGKTTLVETILLEAGLLNRRGIIGKKKFSLRLA